MINGARRCFYVVWFGWRCCWQQDRRRARIYERVTLTASILGPSYRSVGRGGKVRGSKAGSVCVSRASEREEGRALYLASLANLRISYNAMTPTGFSSWTTYARCTRVATILKSTSSTVAAGVTTTNPRAYITADDHQSFDRDSSLGRSHCLPRTTRRASLA